MVFESLAKAILTFVNWGITILVFMLIYEVFRLIAGGEKGAEKAGDVGKEKLGKWWKKRRRRQKTRLLREYLEEEKEMELIDKVKDSITKAVSLVQAIINKKKIDTLSEKQGLIAIIVAVNDALDEAIGHFGKLKMRTWRQERETGKLIEKLEEAGASVDNLKVYEKEILDFHKKTKNLLTEARSYYKGKIKDLRDELNKKINVTNVPASHWPLNLPPTASGVVNLPVGGATTDTILLKKVFNDLKRELGAAGFNSKINEAEKKQKEAITRVQAIITESRHLWK